MGIEPTRGRANDPSTALKAAGPTRRPDTPRKSDCTLHYWKPQVPVFRRSRVRRSGCCYNELMFRLVVIVALVVAAALVAGLGAFSHSDAARQLTPWYLNGRPVNRNSYWLKDFGQNKCLYFSSFKGWLRVGIVDGKACPGKNDDNAWEVFHAIAMFPLTRADMTPEMHIPGVFISGRFPIVGFGLRGWGVSHGFVCVALVAYPAGVLLTGLIRRTRRKNSGACFRCGYNLTGNVSGICPECGSNTRPNHDAQVP